MENLTLAQWKDFAIVLLALAGVVVLIGNAGKTIKSWKKPHEDNASWRRDVDTKLDNDNKRLKDLALLSHEINGNSDDKLRASHQEITNYLIER